MFALQLVKMDVVSSCTTSGLEMQTEMQKIPRPCFWKEFLSSKNPSFGIDTFIWGEKRKWRTKDNKVKSAWTNQNGDEYSEVDPIVSRVNHLMVWCWFHKNTILFTGVKNCEWFWMCVWLCYRGATTKAESFLVDLDAFSSCGSVQTGMMFEGGVLFHWSVLTSPVLAFLALVAFKSWRTKPKVGTRTCGGQMTGVKACSIWVLSIGGFRVWAFTQRRRIQLQTRRRGTSWKNSSMELAVIWINFSCSDLACSDLACSDLACSDLGHSDLACSIWVTLIWLTLIWLALIWLTFLSKFLLFSLNIHNLGTHLAYTQMKQISPNGTFTHCFTIISTY